MLEREQNLQLETQGIATKAIRGLRGPTFSARPLLVRARPGWPVAILEKLSPAWPVFSWDGPAWQAEDRPGGPARFQPTLSILYLRIGVGKNRDWSKLAVNVRMR